MKPKIITERMPNTRINKLALSLLIGLGTGCTTVPPAPVVSMSELPNCFDSNYDRDLGLFTIMNPARDQVNQQCLLMVGSGENVASASQLAAGRYRVSVSGGGGGGAGGTLRPFRGTGGGGGGGGAGGLELQATLNVTEGVYKLTIGAGGPGGTACVLGPYPELIFGGGPGWLGAPSNMIRVATGEVVIGTTGADTYARPTRAQNERMAGPMDGHGGSGPGQSSGGRGGTETADGIEVEAQPGSGILRTAALASGGQPGTVQIDKDRPGGGGGGGGGATSLGRGGGGGAVLAYSSESGATPVANAFYSGGRMARRLLEFAPERGVLGSGGGGGAGTSVSCSPGAPGGHGFIVFRPD